MTVRDLCDECLCIMYVLLTCTALDVPQAGPLMIKISRPSGDSSREHSLRCGGEVEGFLLKS